MNDQPDVESTQPPTAQMALPSERPRECIAWVFHDMESETR